MSSYAAELREEASSWASAFMQFETGRAREGFRAYAFVEDDDDKSFYQVALTPYDNVCFLGCGGKTGVLAVYNKLQLSGLHSAHMFFVDRDTELEPFEHGDDVLRTASYSWESHVCETDYVGWYLQRKVEPNLSLDEKAAAERAWKDTVSAFKAQLDRQASLCQTALILGESLGVSEIVFWRDAVRNGSVLSPGPSASEWHKDVVSKAIEYGASLQEINDRERFFSTQDTFQVARGKALFALLRGFVAALQQYLGRTVRGEWNSPRVWIDAMPWTDHRLEYVREYAYTRIGAP